MRMWIAGLRGLLVRPTGEWLFLALLALLGANALRNGVTASEPGAWETSVQAGNIVVGALTWGIAAAIVARRRWGLPLLWLWSAAIVYTGCVAAWKLGGAPAIQVMGTAMMLMFISAAVLWYGTRRLHAGITQRMWPVLVEHHASAVEEYVAAISGMDLATWNARRTPEAWSAAEITEHLVRTYAQFAGEARGKNSLRVRVPFLRRLVIRLFIKPRLLAGQIFPRARAPRELRPTGGPATPADGVAMFLAAGEGCIRDIQIMSLRHPYRTMVHPYFGAIPMYELMEFASQHIRHHRRQLPS
ncbi:MAG: DinB family protein [Gemmatimonadaceae bacterium]